LGTLTGTSINIEIILIDIVIDVVGPYATIPILIRIVLTTIATTFMGIVISKATL
jgi:hypothetical protein